MSETTINICSPSGEILLATPINSGAKGYFSLMQHDYVTLPFSLDNPIDFGIGSYADLRGVFSEALGGKLAKIYYVTSAQSTSYNTATGGYDYQLRLDAYYWLWQNFIFKYTPGNAGSEASWSLTAALDVHLGVYLRNLASLGFTYGTGQAFTFEIDSTVENKAAALTYDNTNLIEALNMMAESWGCEWWVTENTIHFGRYEQGDAVELEIGVSAETMTRSESKGTYATRIYAFGSTRNIPSNYRPSTEQAVVNGVVQKRLMLPEGTPYIDAHSGLVRDQVVESVVVFDNVYPRRTGTLSNVQTVDRPLEGEGVEEGSTFKAYQYKDTGLIFSEDYILPEQELRIVFQSGKLNGLDFGVTFNPNESDPAEQLWEIVANEDYGRLLPDATICPENGDTYILYGFDIQMVSDQYIPAAEQELKTEAEKYVEKTKVDDGIYTVPLYSSWVKEDEVNRTFDAGQRIKLVNPAFFGQGGRVSRVIGWEMSLVIPYDSPVYTIGESAQYSRLGELEDKVDAITYGGQTYAGGGGSSVYLIKTNDSTPASNSNAFSALRAINEFLSKTKPDSTACLLKLLSGAEFGEYLQGVSGGKIDADGAAELLSLVIRGLLTVDELRSKVFTSGALGSGFTLKIDDNGDSYLEIDRMLVRKVATFIQLLIQELKHVGGQIVLSPASMQCSKVEDMGTYYRCYFENTDGDKTINQEFAVNDQARCQTFNIKEGVHENVTNTYYWRLVVGVGDNYIDLSKSDCDAESTVPQAGDDIVQLGNRTDATRQGAIVLSAYGADSPSIKLYKGINSYSLAGKERISLSPQAVNIIADSLKFSTGENVKDELDTAKENAEQAKNDAEHAKSDAEAAKNRLDQWAADGVISPTEKQGLKDEIARIKGDYDEINAQYSKYGLGTPSTYNSAYNSYMSVLTTLSADTPETIAIPSYFASRQRTYYTQRTAALNAIATAAKDYVDDMQGTITETVMEAVDGKITLAVKTETAGLKDEILQETESKIQVLREEVSLYSGRITTVENDLDTAEGKISSLESRVNSAELKITPDAIISTVSSNLKVGYSNMMEMTGNFGDSIPSVLTNNGGGISLDTSVKYEGYNTIRTSVGNGFYYNKSIYLEKDTEYCYSAMVKGSKSYTAKWSMFLHMQSYNSSGANIGVNVVKSSVTLVANQWTLVYIVFKLYGNSTGTIRPFIYDPYYGGTVNVAFMCISKGNVPMYAYDSAPQEAKSAMVQTANGFTFYGKEVNIKASILTAENIAALNVAAKRLDAATGTFVGTVSIASGKILLNSDGSGKLANGAVSWDAAGNVTFNERVDLNKAYTERELTPSVKNGRWRCPDERDAFSNVVVVTGGYSQVALPGDFDVWAGRDLYIMNGDPQGRAVTVWNSSPTVSIPANGAAHFICVSGASGSLCYWAFLGVNTGQAIGYKEL